MNRLQLLCKPPDYDAAIVAAHELLQTNPSILIVREDASKTQYDRLNKELRKTFYVTRHELGFVVHSSRKR